MVFRASARLDTLRESWLPSVSSLPLAGETTEGEAGCEDFFNSLLPDSSSTFSSAGTYDYARPRDMESCSGNVSPEPER